MKSAGVKMRKIAIASVLGLALLIGMVTSALAITNGQTNRNEPPMSAWWCLMMQMDLHGTTCASGTTTEKLHCMDLICQVINFMGKH